MATVPEGEGVMATAFDSGVGGEFVGDGRR
jgi:hypothetical protein